MPLSKKARVEVYIPDLFGSQYQELLKILEREFTYTFGGCTINRELSGSFQSRTGLPVPDRISLIYTDTAFDLEESLPLISVYMDDLRQSAFRMLNEEAILVAGLPVYHSEP